MASTHSSREEQLLRREGVVPAVLSVLQLLGSGDDICREGDGVRPVRKTGDLVEIEVAVSVGGGSVDLLPRLQIILRRRK